MGNSRSSDNATIYNTIVWGNTLGDGVTASNIFGTLDNNLATGQTASSNNLIGTGGSGGLVNGVRGNLVGVANAKLGALVSRGAPKPASAGRSKPASIVTLHIPHPFHSTQVLSELSVFALLSRRFAGCPHTARRSSPKSRR
jgi:hypothetical protein